MKDEKTRTENSKKTLLEEKKMFEEEKTNLLKVKAELETIIKTKENDIETK